MREVPGSAELGQALERPDQLLLTDAVEDWAWERPELEAIRQSGRAWTYADLVARAREVACQLVAGDLRRGEVVGVFGVRSFGLVAAMLGVLRSGGVLLPLDPALPPGRKRRMLEEARAKRLVCVGGEAVLADLRSQELHLCAFDPLGGAASLEGLKHEERSVLRVPATGGAEPPPREAALELPSLEQGDPAYLFFTSGTTGIPKGVLGCHRGLAHFLSWQQAAFQVEPGDRIGQLTGLSFDVVLRDLFLALRSGATLCLPEPDVHVASPEIMRWMGRERLTILHTTPTLAQHWLSGGGPRSAPPLRCAFFAGEPLLGSLVREWRAVHAGCEVVNLYGPTETSLAKFFYRVPEEVTQGIQPLGRPLPQTEGYVVSAEGDPLGAGEEGEIVIRTPFRSLGYLNASEEHELRFVRNPLRADAEDVLYRTGDLGRYRPDGLLEIRGRMDDQVKIRGERIEPSEVSSVLSWHPSIRGAFVQVRTDPAGEKVLVAYLAVKGRTIIPRELRKFLREHLPASMIPTAFVLLEVLPLTPNGKVDRAALPEPDYGRGESQDEYVAPRDEVERKLVELWESHLNVTPIGVRDDFYDLGGYSLLAMRLFSGINREFGTNFPIDTLFRASTIEDLAPICREETGDLADTGLVAIQAEGARRPVFFVPGVLGGLLYFRRLSHHLGPDQPFYGLRAKGADRAFAPYTELGDVAAAFVRKIRAFQPEGPYQVGGHSFGCTVAFEVARQLAEQGQAVEPLLFLNYHLTFRDLLAGVDWKQNLRFKLRAVSSLGYRARARLVLNLLARRVLSTRVVKRVFRHYRETGRRLPRILWPINSLRLVNYAAELAYRPRPIPGRIVMFNVETNQDPWAEGLGGMAEGGFEVVRVKGGHDSMLQEPHVADLAAQVARFLDQEAACAAESSD